ncbi:MAG: Ig-like domain-containing protein [Lachnospiraceae bacterium]|nr:Ig-like domain-containing protein [Lachnospiraceae bacterium]
MKHWRKGLKRITAAALAAMMIGTIVDASALIVLAEEATEVTCNHVCDEACGGTEAASGSALAGCTHVHDEICGYNADGYSYNAETNTYEVYKAGAMQAAIDAAEVSGTAESPAIIKLMADLDLPGVAPDLYLPDEKLYGVLIDAGVITIDLNGFTLSNSDAIATIQIGTDSGVSCSAVVTIMDSSAQGNGAVISISDEGENCAIQNYCGTLFINSGTIKAEGTAVANGVWNTNGKVTVNGGKIYASTTSTKIVASGIFSQGTNNPSLTVNGGEISGNGTYGYGIYAHAGTFTIKDGTIAGGKSLSIADGVKAASITGGSFTGSISTYTDGLGFLGIDENGKGATFPNGITVTGNENNTLNAILATGAGFYDASGNLLTVADDATSINETVTVGCASHIGGTATCAKKAVCTTCGREYGELDANNHGEMDETTGECSNGCGNFLAVASVTTGEGTTYYTDFANALENWADGTTLTLLEDATYGTTDDDTLYILNKSVTLDLNGHTLNLSGNHTTIQVGEYENAAGTLTILDSGVNGTLKSVGNSVVVYDNCNIQGGNLIGRVYVMTTATLNMTGGSITTDDTTLSYEAVWNDGEFHISGGTLTAKSRGIANVGTLTITGSPTIIDNGGAAVWNAEQGNVTISGTPTFSSSSYELYIRQKITLNTQPADGTTWKVYVDTGYITNGVFAIPGEGVTLDASKFTSAMDGYDVGWNAKGELLLCNHTEQAAVSNGNGTHNTTCYCGKTTYETNVACSGGVATDTSQAYCDYCNAPYGELNPDVHYDIVAANMTEEQLQSALTELLNAGETDIIIVLAAKADEEMFTAINTALRSSTAADGSINLTIGGVKTIPSYAFGNGHPEESQNTDPYELKTLTLPDAVTLKKNAIVAPKLEAVYAPKVTEWEVWAVWNDYEAMNTIILSAPGTITANFTGLNTENIDLVLNCDKKNDVTDGTTWQGETWKSITFVHSWTNGTCTVCGVTCDHSGSTHEKATDKGDGTHSFTCSVCGSIDTEDHDFSYNANNNVITATCEVCETTFGTATVTAENATYDGTAKEVTVTTTGTLANAELAIAYYEGGILLDAAPVNAGTYTAKISYNEKTASIDYTIAKAESAVATAPTVKTGLTYTGSAQELVTAGTATCGTMQYSLAENGTYSETIPTGTDAGEYTVWYKVAGDANHNDTAPASVVVTIAPKEINVTARPASKTYGDPDPAIDYVVTGLEGSDALVGTLTREAGENAGTYAITQGTLTNENNPNYNISFVEGTFTINKAAAPAITEPTATAITYGQKLSASILDGNGWLWVNGDTVPGTSGSYDAYIEVDDSNYDYTGVSGYDADTHRVVREATVTVNKATLTITAKSYTIKVGGTLPAYEYEVTGLVNGDALPVEVTASCSAADSNTAGTYDITVSGALSTDCYTITYVNGTLTISEKDTQEITASDVTLTYGEAGKKISATTNGGGAVSYTVATGTDVISVAADGTITVLKAGTATVTIRAAETADYAAATKTISVTVNKAENAPNMPSGTMNVAYDVENVGAVTLPDGWAWKAEDASKALTAGTAVTATAVYSGADKGNYETETVEVVITRSNCSHTFTSEVTKQPTVDAVGERTYTCSTCGYSYTEEIEKLEPTVTPVPTATPTATPRPTVAPTSAPTATPSVTPTPVPGTTTVPSSGETVVDENGDEVTSVVQEPGTTTKLSIPELTDGTPEEGEEAELVTWESSNPDVAEVDEDGNVTMKKPGLTEIVVTVGEGEDARRETIVVLVEEPRTYVNPLEEAFKDVRLGTSWNDIPLIRYQKVGETVDINFYGVKNWKQSNYEYIWQTSDESVAVVDGKGRVTALKPGVVELTLGLKNKADGHFLNVQSVEIVIPGDYENKILLGTSRNNTFDSIVLNLNERIDINFYGVKNWKKEDYEYYWSSSEPSVVWVDSLGRLVPVNPGKAEVFLVLIEKKNKAPRYVVPMEVTVPKK